MAQLICSDDNKNPKSELSFKLNLGEKFNGKNFKDESTKELWLRYSIELKNGSQIIKFDTDKKKLLKPKVFSA